ncbi:hypothetical protein FRACYDRAFT_239612 [Fragilariopsis cylindrus CCMP1102]|uniref:Uncharacterized protein n=1 Tax=Fragilariopsis cylindrus CCMP1102 TaxID=635003 RepID=A0A1E7FFR4_9STRA|nr:hypothetical protein FRACYDRAFT_239612 [Fragilariopsis cylindrus CCMP1102]|eukprot:OEU17011.1 hypothetical protein FRACYDRAFT_239612 [Fragilariopsis cylindrus CCMP1102]
MTKVEIEYDYSGIDRVAGIPTTGQLITFQKQMAKVQTSYKCNITEARDHGWSWIMCTQAQWILKKGITAQVPVPVNPGPYIGDTNILNAAHKQALKLYEEYEEHKRNTNKAIQACFDEDLFIELETDGLLLGVSPHEVYQHMWTNFILQVDKDREILHARELLKADYDPDRIVQHYYKAINEARELLTGLRETVTDAEVMRNAYATFEKNIDLKDACREWNRGTFTTWEDMRKHFSKEIQMNKTDPAIMKRTELANAVLAQNREDENAQRQASEVLVLQTQKIQELEARIEQQQLANSATNQVPGRIPASISTGSSNGSAGGSSATSTVTKEEMMQMFAQFTQNNNQSEGNAGTAKKKKNKFGTEYIRNDLGNGERSKRRYPDSTNYCPSCGYDIKPTHTPGTCTNRKACHNEAATLANKMGGVTTNCHFVT